MTRCSTPRVQALLNRVHERAFLNLLLDLIEISDSFDQLQKLALIVDLLFSPFEEQYKELSTLLEKTAKHLRDNRNIGYKEVKQEVKQEVKKGFQLPKWPIDHAFDSSYCNCEICQAGRTWQF